ncbi:MAG: hypothetical protein M3024_01465 [Candidatus Dormibacteraeota bacterium]|nr:hypothetical protein [Candidatus Dormibacteraeota bacterium]
MNDQATRRLVKDYVIAGIPAEADLSGRVATLATGRRPRSRRAIWVVGMAAAATLAGTVVVSAVNVQNFPARLHLLQPPARLDAPVDKAARRGQEVGKPAAPAAKQGAQPTTLASAEQSFGTHVLTVRGPGAQLKAVYFQPASRVEAGAKPGSKSQPDSVSLIYTYAGTTAEIQETIDNSPAPLTVDAIDQNGPTIKSGQGLGPVAVESVGGSDYVVGRTSGGALVEWVIWKTGGGVVVMVHFDNGIDHQKAFDFATHVGQ